MSPNFPFSFINLGQTPKIYPHCLFNFILIVFIGLMRKKSVNKEFIEMK